MLEAYYSPCFSGMNYHCCGHHSQVILSNLDFSFVFLLLIFFFLLLKWLTEDIHDILEGFFNISQHIFTDSFAHLIHVDLFWLVFIQVNSEHPESHLLHHLSLPGCFLHLVFHWRHVQSFPTVKEFFFFLLEHYWVWLCTRLCLICYLLFQRTCEILFEAWLVKTSFKKAWKASFGPTFSSGDIIVNFSYCIWSICKDNLFLLIFVSKSNINMLHTGAIYPMLIFVLATLCNDHKEKWNNHKCYLKEVYLSVYKLS